MFSTIVLSFLFYVKSPMGTRVNEKIFRCFTLVKLYLPENGAEYSFTGLSWRD